MITADPKAGSASAHPLRQPNANNFTNRT
jgi:hypothetical protein